MNTESIIADNVQQAVPFFNVSSMQDSLRFYIDGLGFEIAHKWIDEGQLRWCSLKLGGASLMLQEFKRQGHDSWVPQCKVGEGVSICFICKDAISIYHEAKLRGLTPSRPMVGNKMWVTSLSDPDGYRIDFESYTDEVEDSVLKEE